MSRNLCSPMYNRTGSAVDLDECRTRGYRRKCRCGVCAVCGFQKHMAIHSKCEDGKPWGHGFVPAENEEVVNRQATPSPPVSR